MSDAENDDKDKKHDKKDAAAEAAPAAAGGVKALIGPLLGAVVLLGAGAGIGWFVAKSLTPAPVAPAAKVDAHGAPANGHGGPEAPGDEHGQEGGVDSHGKTFLDLNVELLQLDIKTNINDQGGRRFLAMSVAIWGDKLKVNANLFTEPAVKRLIQAKIEEQMKTYTLQEVLGPNITARLAKDLTGVAERTIGSLVKGKAPGDKLVTKVVITGLMVE